MLSATFALSGCSATNNSSGFSIPDSEMSRADAMPALPGYETATQIDDVFKLGTSAPVGEKSEHIVGTIRDILPIETTKVGLLNLTKTWVPILIDLEQSTPEIHRSQLVLRVFPSSENMPTLATLKKGERILAIGVAPTTDESNTFGVSLGWMFEITDSGEIVSTTDRPKSLGKFASFADQLGLNRN